MEKRSDRESFYLTSALKLYKYAYNLSHTHMHHMFYFSLSMHIYVNVSPYIFINFPLLINFVLHLFYTHNNALS